MLCDFPYLDVSLIRDILKDDGLHGEDIGKLHLRDVECTHNVGPACRETPVNDQWLNLTPRLRDHRTTGRETYRRCLSSWGRHPCGGTARTSETGQERAELVVSVVMIRKGEAGKHSHCVTLTTRAALSCDSHLRQNHGPVGTWTMP